MAYAIVSWLLIQIVTAVEEPLSLPGWFDTAIIVLLAVGFPIAVILAWAFELTPDGIKPTKTLDQQDGITRQSGQRFNVLIIAGLAIAVAYLVIDNYVLNRDEERDVEAAATQAQAAVAASTVPEAQTLPNSIAVLPLENLSPNQEDAYFAIGLHEEILNHLAKLSNLNVIARTTMGQYAGTAKSLDEIASELNVETVMEGSVRYANGLVRITTQLIDPADGTHLWSETYERPFDDIFAIESDIAMNVANAMVVEFSLEEQGRIEDAPTDSPEAYALYLATIDYLRQSTREAAEHCLETIDQALEIDPNFVEAWFQKALCHEQRTAFMGNTVPMEQAAAREAIDRALALDPNFALAHAELSMNYASRGEWLASAEHFFLGRESGLDLAESGNDNLFFSVGQISAAKEIALAIYQQDPLNSTNAFWLMNLYEILGESRESDRTYRRGLQLYADWPGGQFNRLQILLGRGTVGELQDFDFPDELPLSAEMAGLLDDEQAALANLRERASEPAYSAPRPQLEISVWAAFLGDKDLALQALQSASSELAVRVLNFWMPVYRDVRQMPAFKQHMRDIGMVEFWKTYGWPDQCEPVGQADFSCR